jgi:hypothetical protein
MVKLEHLWIAVGRDDLRRLKPLVSHGQMLIARQQGLWWHQQTPFVMTLLLDDKRMVVKSARITGWLANRCCSWSSVTALAALAHNSRPVEQATQALCFVSPDILLERLGVKGC